MHLKSDLKMDKYLDNLDFDKMFFNGRNKALLT